jgi:hypothetical protein
MSALIATTESQYKPFIASVINENYSDLKDMGEIDSFIQQAYNTSDFDLPNGYKLRIKEEHGSIYYTVFRAK